MKFWVIQSFLQHGKVSVKLFSPYTSLCSLLHSDRFPSHEAQYSHICFCTFLMMVPFSAALCHIYSKPTYPSGPKLNSTTSIISPSISQPVPSFSWIHCFYNTIQGKFFITLLQHYPIITCIITLILYVLRLPTAVPVTMSTNTSLHHHPRPQNYYKYGIHFINVRWMTELNSVASESTGVILLCKCWFAKNLKTNKPNTHIYTHTFQKMKWGNLILKIVTEPKAR